MDCDNRGGRVNFEDVEKIYQMARLCWGFIVKVQQVKTKTGQWEEKIIEKVQQVFPSLHCVIKRKAKSMPAALWLFHQWERFQTLLNFNFGKGEGAGNDHEFWSYQWKLKKKIQILLLLRVHRLIAMLKLLSLVWTLRLEGFRASGIPCRIKTARMALES
jgi:hypothetical protein